LQRQFNLVKTFSISTGTHQLKAGVDYRRLSPSYTPPGYTQEGAFQNLCQVEAGKGAWGVLNPWGKARAVIPKFSAFLCGPGEVGPTVELRLRDAMGGKPGAIFMQRRIAPDSDRVGRSAHNEAGAREYAAVEVNLQQFRPSLRRGLSNLTNPESRNRSSGRRR